MRSTTSPYEPFEAYYPLEEVVDTYMEIWYNSDSDDSNDEQFRPDVRQMQYEESDFNLHGAGGEDGGGLKTPIHLTSALI
mgnify:CR=1 FL=1